MKFDDDAHKLKLVPQSPQLLLEFGNRLFFTSLTQGLSAQAIEASLATSGSAFNNFLVFPAILFLAESVALVPANEALSFLNRFEFGFIQGIRWGDVHLDYWGSTASQGRTTVHITMPNMFEVDTDAGMSPWTRAAGSRFQVQKLSGASGNSRFKVTSDFSDHPMLMFPHTLNDAATARRHLLRLVQFRIQFRTIFCFRDRTNGAITAISSTNWEVKFDHLVSYSSGGTVRNVNNRVGPPFFPGGGSPSNIEQVDRDVVAMAKRGSPLHTPAVLRARLHDPNQTTVTDETPNSDFVQSFFS